jgi:hypothetical protein
LGAGKLITNRKHKKMKNETKQDQQYKSAHISALEAIVKRLGKGADREQVLEVVMVMAHGLLTHEQKLDLNLSRLRKKMLQ